VLTVDGVDVLEVLHALEPELDVEDVLKAAAAGLQCGLQACKRGLGGLSRLQARVAYGHNNGVAGAGGCRRWYHKNARRWSQPEQAPGDGRGDCSGPGRLVHARGHRKPVSCPLLVQEDAGCNGVGDRGLRLGFEAGAGHVEEADRGEGVIGVQVQLALFNDQPVVKERGVEHQGFVFAPFAADVHVVLFMQAVQKRAHLC
jgi:hypothetical protein